MTRSCNHHDNCDRAERRHPGIGHCHSPDCEAATAQECPWVQSGQVHTLAGLLRPGSRGETEPGLHSGQVASSTPPIPCWSCGRDFSIGYVEGGEMVAFHALPMCAAYEACNTVAEAARFAEKCRLAEEPTLS
jgi:hypothetical protein